VLHNITTDPAYKSLMLLRSDVFQLYSCLDPWKPLAAPVPPLLAEAIADRFEALRAARGPLQDWAASRVEYSGLDVLTAVSQTALSLAHTLAQQVFCGEYSMGLSSPRSLVFMEEGFQTKVCAPLCRVLSSSGHFAPWLREATDISHVVSDISLRFLSLERASPLRLSPAGGHGGGG
jgi:hypothetical protein